MTGHLLFEVGDILIVTTPLDNKYKLECKRLTKNMAHFVGENGVKLRYKKEYMKYHNSNSYFVSPIPNGLYDLCEYQVIKRKKK